MDYPEKELAQEKHSSLTVQSVTSDDEKRFWNKDICALYYKPITIVNDDSSIFNKLDTSIIDHSVVVIYNHHMFIVQATGFKLKKNYSCNLQMFLIDYSVCTLRAFPV